MTHPQASQPAFLQALCPQERALTPLDPLGSAHLDLTQTTFPRRASMTCTCEGLKNVTSHPFLHSPGAATAGPTSSRVFAGWGKGLCPCVCRPAGIASPPPVRAKAPTAALHLAAYRSQREISMSVSPPAPPHFPRETPATYTLDPRQCYKNRTHFG